MVKRILPDKSKAVACTTQQVQHTLVIFPFSGFTNPNHMKVAIISISQPKSSHERIHMQEAMFAAYYQPQTWQVYWQQTLQTKGNV